MNKSIIAAMEASPSAMLVVKDGRISHANSLAAALLGCREGASPVGLIPNHILSESSNRFVSSAIINDRAWTVRVENSEGSRYISLEPQRDGSAASGILSDGLISSMLSTIFNIGLVTDRLSSTLAESDSKTESYLSLLSHNYFIMRHSLSNISTAIALRKGSLPFSFQATDLCALCSELCSTVALMCRSRKLNIRFSTRLGELYAWVDSEKVERIILNLLSNAIAHTPQGGSISLGLEKSGSNAYISVDDTGRGISPAVMAELFTAYEREPELSEMADFGGGLGLGIARGLAEAHDGALIIESRQGKGTSVRVMLPLKTERLSVLESPRPNYLNSGMTMMLTELASVLDKESYDKKYRD